MSLEGKISRQKLTYFGHVMRANSLEKDLLLGMVSRWRKQGQPKTRWMDTVMKDMNMNQLKTKWDVKWMSEFQTNFVAIEFTTPKKPKNLAWRKTNQTKVSCVLALA